MLDFGGIYHSVNSTYGTLVSQNYSQVDIPTSASINGINIIDFSILTSSSLIKKFNTSGIVQQ